MLLQLPPFAQVPRPDRVVQTSCPELGAIIRNVNTAGSICVALELPENVKMKGQSLKSWFLVEIDLEFLDHQFQCRPCLQISFWLIF
jgi:hypothetical protein